jgi:hypothetical protein|tara:strand:- start:1887 stop:2174 length:288 start_codon:yes stop_codon:yes gene_type:complete
MKTMAVLDIVIPEDIYDRVLEGFACSQGYHEFIEDKDGTLIPNPQTKADFLETTVQAYITNSVVCHEVADAVGVTKEEQTKTSEEEIILSGSIHG